MEDKDEIKKGDVKPTNMPGGDWRPPPDNGQPPPFNNEAYPGGQPPIITPPTHRPKKPPESDPPSEPPIGIPEQPPPTKEPSISPRDPEPPSDPPPSDPPATPPTEPDPPANPPSNPPPDPPSENKNNLSDEPQNNKELNMKEKSVIALFSMGAIMIRVPKEQVKFPFETELPCLCLFNEEKMIGIADEFDSQTNEYCIDVNKDKVFSYTRFDDSDIPDKVGAELYITADGKLTKTKGSNKKVGMFLAKKHNAILFKLD